MVTVASWIAVVNAAQAAAGEAEPLWRRLDPQQRGAITLTLAALVILGLGLIAAVWLGAQHVRRLARQRPLSHSHGTNECRGGLNVKTRLFDDEDARDTNDTP